MDRFDAMRLFVRVVESGNFSTTAREFGIGQPAVSKRITALERHLGARLLNRNTVRVAPTELGTAYYQRCLRVLAELEDAEAVTEDPKLGPSGTLRLSAPVAFGRLHVVPRLQEFLHRHPRVRVDLLMSDSFVNLVEDGIDVAIRIGALGDSALVARRLGHSPRLTVATPGYFKAHGVPQHPNDLLQHNCIVYSFLATNNEWHFRGAEGEVAVRVNGNIRVNNSEAVRELVLGGAGIAVAPAWLIGRELATGKLRPVLQDFTPTPLEIAAVYPSARHLAPKTRAFIDYIAACWRRSKAFT